MARNLILQHIGNVEQFDLLMDDQYEVDSDLIFELSKRSKMYMEALKYTLGTLPHMASKDTCKSMLSKVDKNVELELSDAEFQSLQDYGAEYGAHDVENYLFDLSKLLDAKPRYIFATKDLLNRCRGVVNFIKTLGTNGQVPPIVIIVNVSSDY